MRRTRTLTAVKALILTAFAFGSFVGTASAADLKGTFRLPHDVVWGRAELPAGSYTITMDSIDGPAIIRSSTGKAVALVMAQYRDDALEDLPTSLLITRFESQRVVRALNWPRDDRVFVYGSLPEEEPARFARAKDTEIVPVRMASR